MARVDVSGTGVRPRSRGRFGRWFIGLLVLLAAGVGLWTWLSLSWAYAEGERAGVLQKFVRRGWLCKTHEGEIALYYGGGQYMGASTSPQLWDFSVRDQSVAADLTKAVGHRVQLHYTEHPGLPTDCFSDTRYFVDKVTITDGESRTPGSGAGPAPAAAAQPSIPAQAGGLPPLPSQSPSPPPPVPSPSPTSP